MDCETARQALRKWFDEDAALTADVDAHVSTCDACRAYQDRLVLLMDVLPDVPIEAPSDAFVARLQECVGREASPAARPGVFDAAGAAVLVALLGVSAWVLPDIADLGTWWQRVEPWIPRVDLRSSAGSMVAQAGQILERGLGRIGTPEALSGGMLWALLGALAVFWLGFNGIEAAWLRMAAPGTRSHRSRAGVRSGKGN